MKLHYTPRAIADLEEIADYLKSRSALGAQNVRNAILSTLKTLTDFPRIGCLQTTSGVRKICTRKYPYLVYYTVDDVADEIIILAVRHTARERNFPDT